MFKVIDKSVAISTSSSHNVMQELNISSSLFFICFFARGFVNFHLPPGLYFSILVAINEFVYSPLHWLISVLFKLVVPLLYNEVYIHILSLLCIISHFISKNYSLFIIVGHDIHEVDIDLPGTMTAVNISRVPLLPGVWYYSNVVGYSYAGQHVTLSSDGFTVDIDKPTNGVINDGIGL